MYALFAVVRGVVEAVDIAGGTNRITENDLRFSLGQAQLPIWFVQMFACSTYRILWPIQFQRLLSSTHRR